MKKLNNFLKNDVLKWLLEEGDSSIRYYTLNEILEEQKDSEKILKIKKDIMQQNTVVKILSKQHSGGFWEEKEKFYTAKYKGTVWQLIILAELGADGKDERIRKACEFIFHHSQDKESGGFSVWLNKKTGGGRHSGVIPCLTGNMVFSLIRFGYLEDKRLQKAIDWINLYQRFDDGITKKLVGWPYEKAEPCWGKHTCHMGVVKTLKALVEIPSEKRNKETSLTIQ
ncbi:MAG: nitrogen fixation protein NifH, partial [Candidatus Bathyarchaeota archaeon]|nr:nitrogen fixation protein NifH [Candidatus Bathyarchaeota archaeon]